MNRKLQPCPTCAKYIPAGAGTGRCTEFDVLDPCPLYLERGSKAARLAMRSSAEVLADLRRRYPEETISRASASTAAPTRKATP